MRNTDVRFGVWDAEELVIDEKELSRRLGVKTEPNAGSLERGAYDALLGKCRKSLFQAADWRYAYVKVPVSFPEEGVCQVGSIRIESRHLCINLRGCSAAYLLGVTTGIGVDRLLQRLSLTSQSEHFVMDALSSAAVESLCDAVDAKIRQEELAASADTVRFHPRYSPGYGDCSIQVQRPLLERLQAAATLGITLNDACFMTPVKSITAIMGIET